MQTLNGRRGFFLALNEHGFESDVLKPNTADDEATRLIFDATGHQHQLRIVWCYADELSAAKPPVYYDVGIVQTRQPTAKGRPVAIGVWQACENHLISAGKPANTLIKRTI